MRRRSTRSTTAPRKAPNRPIGSSRSMVTMETRKGRAGLAVDDHAHHHRLEPAHDRRDQADRPQAPEVGGKSPAHRRRSRRDGVSGPPALPPRRRAGRRPPRSAARPTGSPPGTPPRCPRSRGGSPRPRASPIGRCTDAAVATAVRPAAGAASWRARRSASRARLARGRPAGWPARWRSASSASTAAAGQDHVEGAALADQARQAHRAAVEQRHAAAPAEDAEHGRRRRRRAGRTTPPAPARRPPRGPSTAAITGLASSMRRVDAHWSVAGPAEAQRRRRLASSFEIGAGAERCRPCPVSTATFARRRRPRTP